MGLSFSTEESKKEESNNNNTRTSNAAETALKIGAVAGLGIAAGAKRA